MQNAVHDRVAHVHVRRRHVDFRAQHVAAVGKLAGAHAREQIQVLLDASVSVRALPPGLGKCAPVLADLVSAQAVHVGLAGAREIHRPCVELLEIVRGVTQMLAPVVAEPADVLLDGLDVFHALLDRVGVVETQVAVAAVIFGDAEVEADGLGVADVQIPVGLGRKARHHASIVFTAAQVLVDDLADEVSGRCGFGHRRMCPCAGDAIVSASLNFCSSCGALFPGAPPWIHRGCRHRRRQARQRCPARAPFRARHPTDRTH